MPVVKSKLVSRRTETPRPQKVRRNLGLKEYYQKRNKVLIIRGIGGLGDIFMHRMMFEDFKRIMPDAEIHFACPRYYHDALTDHPFIDKLLDLEEVQREDYIIIYNTTTACGREEMKLAPSAGPNRSDIWAAHCGVVLTRHNMHISLTDEERTIGKFLIEHNRDREGSAVCLAPVSAMQTKNFMDHQILGLTKLLREKGLYVFALHNTPIPICYKHDIPMLDETKIRRWMGIIHEADYVISVDTAAFHCAGGMGKPVVGVFTWANGDAYGKHYKKAQIVQGPCPLAHRGCYNWPQCPVTEPLKPCLTEITPEMVMNEVNTMLAKWPAKNSS